MAKLTKTQVAKIVNGEFKVPSQVLGMHNISQNGKNGLVVRHYNPKAIKLFLVNSDTKKSYEMNKIHGKGLFEIVITNTEKYFSYKYKMITKENKSISVYDPYYYKIKSIFDENDEQLFSIGKHYRLYEKFGAHKIKNGNLTGIHFAVWAPKAKYVSVIGSFNDWNDTVNPMNFNFKTGIWELFIPGLKENTLYKYNIVSIKNKKQSKADPYAFASQLRPNRSSKIWNLKNFKWTDAVWINKRKKFNPYTSPVSIYEVHLGSWIRNKDSETGFHNYKTLADKLVSYLKKMKYTHVELLPVSEHPLDESWGYQVTNYFAPTSRYGTPDDFKYFVNKMHENNIGVILDWVPAHFPQDYQGLGLFDGTHLYEHPDKRLGIHPDWKTYIFNYGKPQVKNFLIANALFWIDKYHIDGLRVDAVASMLYLDYSRGPGQWVPNKYGGNSNLAAISLMKTLNETVNKFYPGTMTIAEESTAFGGVTRPVELGGLGFTFKWNMGWMHDILDYMSKNPVHRKFNQNKLTFMLYYAFSEKYILPLSHDEVVHGKKSLLRKMPGTKWQKFANLRLLYGFMYAHPGKKLTFMGSEIAQLKEWSEKTEVNRYLLKFPLHAQIQLYLEHLNNLYQNESVMFLNEQFSNNFQWIDYKDYKQSIIFFARKGYKTKEFLLFGFNFTPVTRKNYKIGVPYSGTYKEIFNSDLKVYGGTDLKNGNNIKSQNGTNPQNFEQYLTITLPPLSMIVLKLN